MLSAYLESVTGPRQTPWRPYERLLFGRIAQRLFRATEFTHPHPTSVARRVLAVESKTYPALGRAKERALSREALPADLDRDRLARLGFEFWKTLEQLRSESSGSG
ncbi:MAG: hypothetical protein H3C58_11440 [Fimbriimonadaceae bacterium]|nr:hypothetical protein [Fimbriimonadaceae bacterium]